MESQEKLYHIYAKGQCIYHSLSEEKFTEIWGMLHKMIEILRVDIKKEDLQYEEVNVSKVMTLNSSY